MTVGPESAPAPAGFASAQEHPAQRRTVRVLALATMLGGLGVGASLSAGALLISDVTGNDALSGFGSTLNNVGAALAGIPLAWIAMRFGRRIALVSGNVFAFLGAILVMVAAHERLSWVLFLGLGLLGVAAAVQLQSRFAATDLSLPGRQAKDLSFVVWSITVGAVIGPNLITPGDALGVSLGIGHLAGIFIFVMIAQMTAGLLIWFALKPDPLIEAKAALRANQPGSPGATAGNPALETDIDHRTGAILVIVINALAQAIMVGLMAMTPLHLTMHGGSITVVGITLSLHIAAMYILSPVFGAWASRVGSTPVMLAGGSLLLCSAIGVGFAGESTWLVQVSMVLLGFGWGMVTVAGAALMTRLTGLRQRAGRQGIADTSMNAGGAIAGACAGVIFAHGHFPLLASVCSALSILCLGLIIWVRLRYAGALSPGQ